MYADILLKHFFAPQNVGEFLASDENSKTIFHEVPTFQVAIRFGLQLDQNNVIKNARFKTLGCPVMIAGSSWLTTWLIGKTTSDATTLTPDHLIESLQIPVEKWYCAKILCEVLFKTLA